MTMCFEGNRGMLTRRLSRRSLLKAGALASATLAIPGEWLAGASPAAAFSQSDRLRKFIQPLRGVGGTGIPLAQPDTVTQPWWQPGVTHYTIDIRQFADQLHPDLPNPTRLWGFGQGPAAHFRHLGGIIAVKRGTPVQITFRNHLPAAPHPARRPLDHGHREPGQQGRRPPSRRPGAVDQRWRPARLVGPGRATTVRASSTTTCCGPAAPCLPTRPSTTTRTSRAPGSSGITTTRSGRLG